MTPRTKIHYQLPFLAVLGIVAILFLYAQSVYSQQAGTSVVGWAWGDNVGWIELHCAAATAGCTTWGLTNNGGSLAGYAWSDSLGWIRAAQAGDGCPGNGATISGATMSGWLKAIGMGVGSDLGCISLSGTSPTYQVVATANANPTYDPSISGAWGSDQLGWIAFNVTSASCSDTNWSCSGTLATRLNGPTCTNISRECAPYTCINGAAPSADPCTDPQGSNGCALSVGALSPCVNKASIKQNSATTLWWSVSNVTSCTITKNGAAFYTGTGSNPAGGLSTGVLAATTVYAMDCTPTTSGAPHFTGSATSNMLPQYKEI